MDLLGVLFVVKELSAHWKTVQNWAESESSIFVYVIYSNLVTRRGENATKVSLRRHTTNCSQRTDRVVMPIIAEIGFLFFTSKFKFRFSVTTLLIKIQKEGHFNM